MSEQLKPCPFCGAKAILKFVNDQDPDLRVWHLYCETWSNKAEDWCVMNNGWFFDSPEDAAAAWNKRVNNG